MHESMVGGAALTNWLAILGVLSLMYWGFRIVTALMARTKAAPARRRSLRRPPQSPGCLSP